MRVLVFGDSVSQGMWDTAGGWVQRLRTHYDQLHIKDGSDQPEIINVSVSGDRIDDVLLRLSNEVESRRWFDEPFGLVIAVGLNDSALENGNEIKDIDRFGQQVDQLVNQCMKLSKKILIVGLTPVDEAADLVNDKTYQYTNERIKAFDNVLRQVTHEAKIAYAPLEGFASRDGVLMDGLHPNNAGHAVLAQILLPHFEHLFERP